MNLPYQKIGRLLVLLLIIVAIVLVVFIDYSSAATDDLWERTNLPITESRTLRNIPDHTNMTLHAVYQQDCGTAEFVFVELENKDAAKRSKKVLDHFTSNGETIIGVRIGNHITRHYPVEYFLNDNGTLRIYFVGVVADSLLSLIGNNLMDFSTALVEIYYDRSQVKNEFMKPDLMLSLDETFTHGFLLRTCVNNKYLESAKTK